MLHCALPQHAAFVAFLYIVKPDVYIYCFHRVIVYYSRRIVPVYSNAFKSQWSPRFVGPADLLSDVYALHQ